MAHGPCLYGKDFICQKASFPLVLLILIIRPKVQLTHLDVDYQQKERTKTRARLEDLKKPSVIPQEKPPANFSFKHADVDLPSPLQPIPSASKDAHMGFERFL